MLATLTVTFVILCTIEGGMNGHAVAWLATIPLCALMMADRRDAIFPWSVLAILIGIVFGYCYVAGIDFPERYPPEWRRWVEVAGYAGLIPFMTLLGYSFEITRRRAFARQTEAIAEIESVNEKLTALNEQQADFLSIAVHDLKNPLSAIMSFAEMIRDENAKSNEQIDIHSNRIIQSSDLMVNIVSQCLNLDSHDDEALELDMQRCEIQKLLDRVASQNEALAKRKGIKLIVDPAPTGCAVIGDDQAVCQVLDNLFSNAIKYSPQNTEVKVTCATSPGEFVIEVTDNGPGLSEEDQSRLFGKFCRLTPRPTGGESSSGLGLWISRRLTEAMMGDIQCRSKLDSGSTFSLKLQRWNDELSVSIS